MFREALGYPTRPPRGGRAVLVGGTLLLVVGVLGGVASLEWALAPVALLAVPPWLLVRGYYVRTIRATLGRKHPTPPGFGGVGRLLRDGVAALVVAVGYLFPPTAILAPLVYARSQDADLVALLLGEGAPAAITTAATAVAGVAALLAIFVLIGALYALPVAVASYAASGRLRAAFDLRTVASGAATEDYVVTWGVSLLLQVLLLPVAYLLKPILVGFYLHFLVAVAIRYCYGQGVGAALDLGPVETVDGITREGPLTGAATPAVRPIEETEVAALRSSALKRERPVNDRRAGERPASEQRGDERRRGEHPEGERT